MGICRANLVAICVLMVGLMGEGVMGAVGTNAATRPVEQGLPAAGNAADAMKIGMSYLDGTNGVGRDYAKAMVYFQQAAADGNAGAMRNIGYMYSKRLQVKQDYQQAMNGSEQGRSNGDV